MIPEKPARLELKPENIPRELLGERRWVLWRWEWRVENGKGQWTKPPYTVGGSHASHSDSSTWHTFEAVMKAYAAGGFDGIGFVLAPPLVGIDFDKARNALTGEPRDWVKRYLQSVDSYTEISPSQQGYKTLAKGKIIRNHHDDRVGIFCSTRYFCITGHCLNGKGIMERQAQIDSLVKERWPQDLDQPEGKTTTPRTDDQQITDKVRGGSEKAQKLFRGEWEGSYASQSEADLALCGLIAGYTKDPEQVNRIFRSSNLYREKWERQDYRQRTIEQAINSRREAHRESTTSSGGGPTMGDLKMFLDMGIDAGQFFTTEQVCRGLGAYSREHKKKVYADLSRLVQEGLIRKDPYRHGGFWRPLQIGAYDISGSVEQNPHVDIKLPLDIQSFIKIERNQLLCIAGRYDAGKSAFLYHAMKLNYLNHKIVHFSSPEWDVNAIKKRMDALGIERPHVNVVCYPMLEGYEDLVPSEPCVVLVDYIRTQEDPRDIDRQFYRILQNLRGGVAFAAIQKHPGQDKPTGGQFAVHAPHHVILLDKLKERDAYICKFLKVKGEDDLEGYFRVFKFSSKGRLLVPQMDTWKRSDIRWVNPKDKHDNNDMKDMKNDAVIPGDAHTPT